MKRALILTFVLLLAACPREFRAVVENQSVADITFISRAPMAKRYVVRAKSTAKVNVHPGCQSIEVDGVTKYIDFSNLPRRAWASLKSGSVIEFSLVYDGARVYLESSNGEPYEISLGFSCNNT
jgi:hypothetical protein